MSFNKKRLLILKGSLSSVRKCSAETSWKVRWTWNLWDGDAAKTRASLSCSEISSFDDFSPFQECLCKLARQNGCCNSWHVQTMVEQFNNRSTTWNLLRSYPTSWQPLLVESACLRSCTHKACVATLKECFDSLGQAPITKGPMLFQAMYVYPSSIQTFWNQGKAQNKNPKTAWSLELKLVAGFNPFEKY